jgi:hypothetical protein
MDAYQFISERLARSGVEHEVKAVRMMLDVFGHLGAHWRDAWQLEHVTARYVISDRPLTEEEWIRERGATVIDGEATDTTPPTLEDKSKKCA